MRKVAASVPALRRCPEQPDEFVTDVDDATQANVRGAWR
jgi:hypothetical protein